MKKSRFSEEQIAFDLRQAESGASVKEVTAVLYQVVAERGLPGEIRVDNGTEFARRGRNHEVPKAEFSNA